MKENITATIVIALGIIAFSACAKSNKFERDQNETVDAAIAKETGVDPDVVPDATVGTDLADVNNAIDAADVGIDVADVNNALDVKTNPDTGRDAYVSEDSDIWQDVSEKPGKRSTRAKK
jgi:hypothetical protein